MKRSTARWTTSLAAAALLGLPVSGMAQTPATAQPPATTSQQPPATTGTQSDSTQNAAAQEHLRQAKAALDSIAPSAVTGKTKTQIAELKRHINALERATGSNSNASATGTAARNPRATAARGNAKWDTEVAAIDKILTNLIGPATSSPSATSATGTTGTTKPTGTSGAANLDEATKTQLTEVRTHVTAFAAAMSGSSSDAPAASSDPSSSATSSMGSTSAPGSTSGSTTGTTDPTSGATSATGSTSQDPAQAAATPQVDAEAARQRLTEARNTLSELTQLPAAAQLSGEARTQVSQLIGNFNELITTQTEWHASYAKVEANLDALLGPDNTDAEPTGGVSTGTAGTTGTAGAVGTSGSATGVANLDPAIRAKLVELRAKLNEFEKAAGGTAAAGAAATGTTGAMTGSTSAATTGSTTGSTSAAGSTTGTTSTTGSTAGTTGSTSGSTATTATPQSTTPQSSTQASEAMGHQEALRHIAAIEAILNVNSAGASSSSTASTSGTTTGTSGSTAPSTASSKTGSNLTLTSAQLDQLKTHLAELRRLVGEAKK